MHFYRNPTCPGDLQRCEEVFLGLSVGRELHNNIFLQLHLHTANRGDWWQQQVRRSRFGGRGFRLPRTSRKRRRLTAERFEIPAHYDRKSEANKPDSNIRHRFVVCSSNRDLSLRPFFELNRESAVRKRKLPRDRDAADARESGVSTKSPISWRKTSGASNHSSGTAIRKFPP